MSWGIDFVAEDKQKAVDRIEAAGLQEHGMPSGVAAALVEAVSRVNTEPYKLEGAVFGIHVKSHGHLDTTGGSSEFTIRVVSILK